MVHSVVMGSKKRKRGTAKASVTDLVALRELDAFISSHGGLAPFRGYRVSRCTPGEMPPPSASGSPESTEAPSSASAGRDTRSLSRLFR